MFQKAKRSQAKLRLALCGPSGSGKTYSALRLAKGLGGRAAMVDTERDRGLLYADHPDLKLDFEHTSLKKPYHPDRYISCIREAEKQGFEILILDSLSHMWMGEGGILELHDTASKRRNGNSFGAWADIRPYENRFVDALIQSNLHIIATMRSKTAWDVSTDDSGKKRMVKIGLKPEQRDNLEYEFTLVFDISMDGHTANPSKDNTSLFPHPLVLDEAAGERLKEWLNTGHEIRLETASKEILQNLKTEAQELGILSQMGPIIKTLFNVDNSRDLTPGDAKLLLEMLAPIKTTTIDMLKETVKQTGESPKRFLENQFQGRWPQKVVEAEAQAMLNELYQRLA